MYVKSHFGPLSALHAFLNIAVPKAAGEARQALSFLKMRTCGEPFWFYAALSDLVRR